MGAHRSLRRAICASAIAALACGALAVSGLSEVARSDDGATAVGRVRPVPASIAPHGTVQRNADVAASTINFVVDFDYLDRAEGIRRPLFYIQLEIWAWGVPGAPGSVERLLVEGRTDHSGEFRVSVPFYNRNVKYYVRVRPQNEWAACCSGWGMWPMTSTSDFIVPGAELPRNKPHMVAARASGETVRYAYTYTGKWASVFNVLYDWAHAAIWAERYERDTSDDAIGQIRLGLAGSGENDASWFDPVFFTSNLTPRDRWDDEVILHEYAHYLQAQISSLAWMPSPHSGCTPERIVVIGQGSIVTWYDGNTAPDVIRQQHAWLEGFADWFAHAMYFDDNEVDFDASGFLVEVSPGVWAPKWENFTCNADPFPPGIWPDGDRFEGHVAAFLFDLTDDNNPAESWDKDGSQRTIQSIFAIFDGLNPPSWPTLPELSYQLQFDPRYQTRSGEEIAVHNQVWWLILN